MSDVASAKSGGRVISASCYDADHPPSLVIDGNDRTFWSTTGLFPQEFIIQLGQTAQVTRIKTLTTNVRRVVVERSEGVTPSSWEKVYEMDIPDVGGRLQVESNQVQRISANFLRFKIISGWGDFATVHKVSVEAK